LTALVLQGIAVFAPVQEAPKPVNMTKQKPDLFRLVLVVPLLVLFALGLDFWLKRFQSGPNPSHHLPVVGRVGDFTLTNQNNAAVSLVQLEGHVWVGDIIFTRCAGPCPKMTRQMRELQDSLPSASQARFITLTTDPQFDAPPVLRNYAARFGADTNRWWFLTGNPEQIAGLARNGLKLSAVPVQPAERRSESDLFIHSTLMVVVDKHVRLRGIFHTTGEGVNWAEEKRKLLSAIQQLEGEL
jgi:cytochrome oxidase Cu insertion factor (SCO1/SenC/PrrC family)